MSSYQYYLIRSFMYVLEPGCYHRLFADQRIPDDGKSIRKIMKTIK